MLRSRHHLGRRGLLLLVLCFPQACVAGPGVPAGIACLQSSRASSSSQAPRCGAAGRMREQCRGAVPRLPSPPRERPSSRRTGCCRHACSVAIATASISETSCSRSRRSSFKSARCAWPWSTRENVLLAKVILAQTKCSTIYGYIRQASTDHHPQTRQCHFRMRRRQQKLPELRVFPQHEGARRWCSSL
jgi:hypothetical protein